MYLRHSKVSKKGKTRTYWRLVRSVRNGSKVRQETVAWLGELDAKAKVKASRLARHFLGHSDEQLDLFEDSTSVDVARVKVREVRVERGRSFGDVWLAWMLWRALKLDEFCKRVLPVGREKVPWMDIASILVIARFCEPSSELHIAEDWYRRTALEDLLGIRPEAVHHKRLYEGLDRILEHKDELEKHLRNRLGELFKLDLDIVLYDVTSTYFEGNAAANPLAQRGYSRDKRPDCKQVCIGLVVTKEGYPLGHEVFPGNTVDVTTVQDIVETMERRYGRARRVWVMDRGMMSAENLEWLRAGGREYLIGTPRSELKRWERELSEKQGWQEVREGLEVKLCSGPDGAETFILCRSEDRKSKEKATHERFATRIEEGLQSLERRLSTAKTPASRTQVERQIGRLFGLNSRAAGGFRVTVVEDSTRASGLRAEWKLVQEWSEWAHLTEGTYILRSNVTDWTAEDLWRTYVQLSDAEAAFRIQKSDLRIRPIWHQKPERVRAHVLVCFLAYCLWKLLEGWQKQAGLGSSPRTVIEEMARIQSVDVVLPLEDAPEVRLRCVVRPDKAQAALLDRLGLALPQRLRSPTMATAM